MLSLFILRERECKRGRGRERERERERERDSQAGSTLCAWRPVRSSNPVTARSLPEPKPDAQPTEPPRRPPSLIFNSPGNDTSEKLNKKAMTEAIKSTKTYKIYNQDKIQESVKGALAIFQRFSRRWGSDVLTVTIDQRQCRDRTRVVPLEPARWVPPHPSVLVGFRFSPFHPSEGQGHTRGRRMQSLPWVKIQGSAKKLSHHHK